MQWVCPVLLLGVLVLLVSAGAAAQEHRWTLNIGGGYTPTVGPLSNRLDQGGHVTAGGGINLTQHFSVIGEYTFTQLGLTGSFLRSVKVPDGNATMHSITLNPKLAFHERGSVGGYVIAGIGWYHRTVFFTQPGVAFVPFYDPWWGFFGTAAVQTNQVLSQYSRDALGGNAGFGLTFKLGETGAKLYTEARYHYINTARTATQTIPVTVGIRW
jgi:hypothetical protein